MIATGTFACVRRAGESPSKEKGQLEIVATMPQVIEFLFLGKTPPFPFHEERGKEFPNHRGAPIGSREERKLCPGDCRQGRVWMTLEREPSEYLCGPALTSGWRESRTRPHHENENENEDENEDENENKNENENEK